jgi:SAM-dependent methyltransferase
MSMDSTAPKRPYVNLFLVSFVILFFELACIRWFGSMVASLTFFTNIVLMACFLGMTIGCMAASGRRNLVATILPLMLLAVFLALATYRLSTRGLFNVSIGNQWSPQQVYFGAEPPANPLTSLNVPVEAIAGAFFAMIALVFVGLGQALGRAFNAIPDRVAAYTVNVAASLAGIAAFGLASYFQTTPLLWFAVCLAILLYLVRPWTPLQIGCQLGVLYLVALSSFSPNVTYSLLWSPYYKITYFPRTRAILTNNIGHQEMVAPAESGPIYVLPHLLNRDAGGKPFGDVMIIGAGSGNDVQAALSHGAKHIDAVEIDPALNALGRSDHPDRPYDDPRVTINLDDGRSFAKKAKGHYDLAVYALVDSLVLHSGYSSLRLESFLFTEQAMRDVKSRLKPDGVFVMCNYYRQGWVVGRLAKMAEQVFGTKPLVISLPYQAEVEPDKFYRGFTFLLVGNTQATAVEAIRAKLKQDGAFWVNTTPRRNESITAYGARPPAVADAKESSWLKIAPSVVDTTRIDRVPTDDWPFLYLREPMIPALNLRGMAVVAALSLVILLVFAPVRTVRPNGQMFFLGAGFMLLETKGVVHMALLFGSTWMVNSVVFFAVLVMILLSNLFVLAAKPRNLWPFYALLVASLLVNAYVPMDFFLSLPGAAKVVASCAVVFVPIFFAGVIFAASFRDSRQPDVDFGSNIGGVILGGLSENVSLMVGFNHLLLLAIGFYVLSAVLKPRVRVPVPDMAPV